MKQRSKVICWPWHWFIIIFLVNKVHVCVPHMLYLTSIVLEKLTFHYFFHIHAKGSHSDLNAKRSNVKFKRVFTINGGGGARGESCHKSQGFKNNNHKSQTSQMLQSQSQRMALKLLKSQVTDKFTDYRVFYLAITDNTSVTSHRLIFSLFTNTRLEKSSITSHR